jgi:hypothetical protein
MQGYGRGGGGGEASLVGWRRGQLGLSPYIWKPRAPNSLTLYIYYLLRLQ